MKICLLTTNPNPFDDRIYYKLARSIKKIASVSVINPSVSPIKKDGISIIGNKSSSAIKKSSWIMERLKIIKPDIIQITEPQLLPSAVKYRSEFNSKLIYDPAEDWSAMYREFSRKPFPIPQMLGFGMRQFENWFLNKMDYFIASDDWLFDYYKSKGPCTLIYNYPTKDIFTVDDKTIKQRPFSIIYHGQLRRERGLFLMIEAMKQVVNKYPDAKLDMVGHFSYQEEKKESQNMINNFGLQKNVYLVAPIPHSEIAVRIAEHTLGLLPFYDIDKFRNNIVIKMFEYSACKLPIVSFDLPPSRKYFEEVECGICVEPDSPSALANGIIALFKDKKKYSLFSRNGYNAFIKKYYWEAQEKQLFDIYTTLFQ